MTTLAPTPTLAAPAHALTTQWTYPSTCSQMAILGDCSSSACTITNAKWTCGPGAATIKRDTADCLPTGASINNQIPNISPGLVCPTGWTTAYQGEGVTMEHDIVSMFEGEKWALCCPSGYAAPLSTWNYDEGGPLYCESQLKDATQLAVTNTPFSCPAFATDAPMTTLDSASTSLFIHGPALMLRWKDSDLAFNTSSPSSSSPKNSSSSSTSGLSTAAKAGIGAGSIALALLLGVLALFLVRRRKKARSDSEHLTGPPPAYTALNSTDKPELMGSEISRSAAPSAPVVKAELDSSAITHTHTHTPYHDTPAEPKVVTVTPHVVELSARNSLRRPTHAHAHEAPNPRNEAGAGFLSPGVESVRAVSPASSVHTHDGDAWKWNEPLSAVSDVESVGGGRGHGR